MGEFVFAIELSDYYYTPLNLKCQEVLRNFFGIGVYLQFSAFVVLYCLRVLPREEVSKMSLIGFVLSIVASVVANYIYDKFGDK